MEVREFQFHPPSLDLRQIENVVDEGQEMGARGVDVLEILLLLLVEVTEHAIRQDFGEADDGVQRCP
jgi:hypothetical protein